MPKVVTTTAFSVTMPNGGIVPVPAGESEQPPEVAEHWFTKAHLVGTPKGRMPVLKADKGIMVEADEAGQLVGPTPMMPDPMAPPVRQEGPLSWSKDNPAAKEAATQAAKDAGTQPSEPVDGKAATAKIDADKKSPPKPEVIVQPVPMPAAAPAPVGK